jgi:hypothetical protein
VWVGCTCVTGNNRVLTQSAPTFIWGAVAPPRSLARMGPSPSSSIFHLSGSQVLQNKAAQATRQDATQRATTHGHLMFHVFLRVSLKKTRADNKKSGSQAILGLWFCTVALGAVPCFRAAGPPVLAVPLAPWSPSGSLENSERSSNSSCRSL